MKQAISNRRPKFVFVTGGVVSSLGKGLAAASIAALMENRGLKVALLKLDPYINIDPGTMSPFQHGEVYVTDDGAETDLDLGHYERFTSSVMSTLNNITSGKIYQRVIDKERKGEYLGATVQVIPHVTDEIKAVILAAAKNHDLCICEIGGTVGDIESLPFLEAIRQIQYDVGKQDAMYIHLTLVPYIKTAGEVKTKPTQHSVKELRAIGISPDILLCRSEIPLDQNVRQKIALFASVKPEFVFTAIDVQCIYQLPIELHREGIDDKIAEILNIWSRAPTLERWQRVVDLYRHPKHEVRIAVVGKYVDHVDSYKSLHEALIHAGIAHESKIIMEYIDSESLEHPQEIWNKIKQADGILVPGGFGSRGIEGKIAAIAYARKNRIPFFGICLGLQVAVIEYARNVANLKEATSGEFDNTSQQQVIALMSGQQHVEQKGATMRLGSYPCHLQANSLAAKLYEADAINERHRHRFEVNNDFRSILCQHGLEVTGTSPDGSLVEIIELPEHPWFLACQFHPEFKSKPFKCHPLFSGFIQAALLHHQQKLKA